MKSTSTRRKRTPPERNGPIRSSIASAARNTAPPGAQGFASTAGTAFCGVLENGVRTAYAVIDEYMRRGQDAAQGFFNDPNRRGAMNDERGNFAGGFNAGSGFGGGYGPWNPMAMMAEQWMSAMRAWSQALGSFVPGPWPQPAAGAYAPAEPHGETVTLKIAASRPVECSVSLNPGAEAHALVCEPLYAEGVAASPIEAAAIAHEGGAVRISATISAEQPAGRYRGLIRRQNDQSLAGELTVILS
jgi:hypothetical protein